MSKCEMCKEEFEKLRKLGKHKYCLKCSRRARRIVKKNLRGH